MTTVPAASSPGTLQGGVRPEGWRSPRQVSVRQNIAWYALAGGIARAAGLVLLPVYTRVLAPAELGTAMVVMAVGAMANLVMAPGIETAYVRCAYLCAESEATKRRGLSTLVALHLTMVVLGIAALIGCARPIGAWWLKGIPLWPFYHLMVGILICSTLQAPLKSSWRAEHRADKIAAIDLISALVATIATLTALLALKWGAMSLLFGELVAGGVLLPVYIRKIVRDLCHGWDAAVFRKVAPVALIGVPMSLSEYVLSSLDRLWLHRWSGPSEVGLYAVGYQVGLAMMALVIILNKEWLPLVFQFTEPGTRRPAILQELWTRSTILFLVIGSAISLFAVEIVRTFLGRQYLASASLVPLIVLMCTLKIPRYFLVCAGLSLGRTRDLTIESLLAVAVFTAFNAALIPAWGATGAASACAATYAVSVLFLFTRSWNVFGLGRPLVVWVIVSGAMTVLAVARAGSFVTQTFGAVMIGTSLVMAAQYWRFLGTVDGLRIQRARCES